MYKQIATNKRNTIVLLLSFVALISGIGALFAYVQNDWGAFLVIMFFAIIYASIQFFVANAALVGITGATEIQKKDNPRLYNIIENLSIAEGLPMPKVYIIEDDAPNAFASGRDPKHALVAATTGLLDIMDDKELTAVMAHEMSHVKNYDIRVSMIAFGLVAVIGVICDLGIRMLFGRRDDDDRSPVGAVVLVVVLLISPLVATLARLAISRQREFLADVSAAKMTRYPEGMIAALRKLQTHGQPMRRQNSAAASLFINNPMKSDFFSKMFSTHPSLESRIKKLEDAKKNF